MPVAAVLDRVDRINADSAGGRSTSGKAKPDYSAIDRKYGTLAERAARSERGRLAREARLN